MPARKCILITVIVVSLTACAAPQHKGPSPKHGFETAGIGIAHLVVSPLLIAAGLLEGLASLPYFVAMDVHELNRGLIESHSTVDVERSVRYAYGQPLSSIPANGGAPEPALNMREATGRFQQVLRGYGVQNYEDYILTALRSADRDGYTLYAVINRPAGAGRRSPRQGDYFRPHQRDAHGRPLDIVIDWAGVSRSSIKTLKEQAILMTIAANSVLTNKRSNDYWSTEKRWRAGDFRRIVANRKAYLLQRLGDRVEAQSRGQNPPAAWKI